ncbi:MAG TPA: glycosyltransferase [bacterium]|nr:glycosyltransferase [bacterium]
MIILACFWWFLSVYLIYCAVENTRLFVKPPRIDRKRKKWPHVSILIPARNEAKRIGPCLKSLLEQDYPNYEILVLDDRSTDDTFDLVQRCGKSDPLTRAAHLGRAPHRVKIFEGKALPEGWLGKPWACYQLSLKARGEWLFFIDADTWHLPETLKRTVQMAEAGKAEALSLLTRQITRTWMEALVIPVMAFHLLAFFPARLALKAKSRFSRFAGVSGQFIFIRRSVYQAFGGHQKVKNEVVEDLNLGKRLVLKGYRVVLGDGSDFSFCRMYTNAGEVWDGFSKNFFPAVGYSIPLFINAIVVLILGGILPFVVLMGCVKTPLFWPALVFSLVLWSIRLLQAVQYRMSKWSVLFHPLGCFLFALIGLNSFRWYFWRGHGYWKGRRLLAPKF